MHYRRRDRATVFWSRCFSVPPLTMHDPPWPICKGWDLHRAPWRGFFLPRGMCSSVPNQRRQEEPPAGVIRFCIAGVAARHSQPPAFSSAFIRNTPLAKHHSPSRRWRPSCQGRKEADLRSIFAIFLDFFHFFVRMANSFQPTTWGTPPCKSSKNSSAPPA